ncbi:PIG-L family deacetylase [Kitasatospora sp. MMS16-BH015]|uniref:PIG-L family deacetylase n=1 Tax=Kitasatospora sp. MMS16-BH015 TaxID=2018025 RepID=UPI0020C49769|nr:PIG-L family deacetylase [Kitasatospora sp. MMS16-BH015]
MPRRPWTRRAVLGAGLAVLPFTELLRSYPLDDRAAEAEVTGTGPLPEGSWSGSYLQIIAHPDDDLYFMNPPLQRAIAQGAPVATVVLTAGEADGKNSSNDSPEHDATDADKAAYTEARHNGLRSAYALMATGDQHAGWRREAVPVADGAVLERCTLNARPTVQLWFCNLGQRLHEEAKAPNGTGVRLRTLWSGAVPAESTLPGAGSPVTAPQDFTRDRVTAVLLDLLKLHRPTTVRTLDPDPEHDPSEKGITAADHIDHTATAQFALAALREYTAATGMQPVVEHYRGYSSKFWPSNLGPADKAEKRHYLMPYAGYGARSCPAHSCGDFQVRPDPGATTHLISTISRYPAATDWLQADGTGRLNAFAVLGGRLVHWREQTPGGEFALVGPLPGEWLLPTVRVLADRAGRLHLVALRRTAGAHGTVGVEVVHTAQADPGGSFAAWESLAGPDHGNRRHLMRREIGTPAAAFDSAGRLHVFVRDFAHELAHRVLTPGGGWSHWTGLGGKQLQDAVTAHTLASGEVEVFASDVRNAWRWRQSGPVAFTPSRVGFAIPVAGALTPVEATPGRTTLYYRQGRSGTVTALRERSNGWPLLPAGLDGHGGQGEVTALHTPDGDLVAHRNDATTLTLRSGSGWADTGGPVTGAPALAHDRLGRLVLAAIGTDARLHVARTREAGLRSPFAPWHTV